MRLGRAFLCLALLPRVMAAQGVAVGVQGQFGSPTRMQYSAGWLAPLFGPLEFTVGGAWIHGDDGDRVGGQAELVLGQRGAWRWYGVASIAGGAAGGGAESPWGGWSAGLGRRMFRLGATEFALEARYLHLWAPDDAVTLGARISTRFGRHASPATPTPSPAPPESAAPPLTTAVPVPPTAVRGSDVGRSAVGIATGAMGTPYLWGGTDANGFDCSGLIHYAFGQVGIVLPRRSVDQAKAGQLVPRDVEDLLPGDILTFSSSVGGPISHVGLYVGDRRFIHSSTGGVRLSVLSAEDPSGQYWFARWVGVRRIQ